MKFVSNKTTDLGSELYLSCDIKLCRDVSHVNWYFIPHEKENREYIGSISPSSAFNYTNIVKIFTNYINISYEEASVTLKLFNFTEEFRGSYLCAVVTMETETFCKTHQETFVDIFKNTTGNHFNVINSF